MTCKHDKSIPICICLHTHITCFGEDLISIVWDYVAPAKRCAGNGPPPLDWSVWTGPIQRGDLWRMGLRCKGNGRLHYCAYDLNTCNSIWCIVVNHMGDYCYDPLQHEWEIFWSRYQSDYSVEAKWPKLYVSVWRKWSRFPMAQVIRIGMEKGNRSTMDQSLCASMANLTFGHRHLLLKVILSIRRDRNIRRDSNSAWRGHVKKIRNYSGSDLGQDWNRLFSSSFVALWLLWALRLTLLTILTRRSWIGFVVIDLRVKRRMFCCGKQLETTLI